MTDALLSHIVLDAFFILSSLGYVVNTHHIDVPDWYPTDERILVVIEFGEEYLICGPVQSELDCLEDVLKWSREVIDP